jgi:hypothetical protein
MGCRRFFIRRVMTDNKPKNVRVEYHIEATINMGNFENQKPGYTVSADVPEGTHPTETRNTLKKLADGWLEQDWDEIKASLK